jgi:hypothetical protein
MYTINAKFNKQSLSTFGCESCGRNYGNLSRLINSPTAPHLVLKETFITEQTEEQALHPMAFFFGGGECHLKLQFLIVIGTCMPTCQFQLCHVLVLVRTISIKCQKIVRAPQTVGRFCDEGLFETDSREEGTAHSTLGAFLYVTRFHNV